jgi:hypothetical protein
MPSHLGKTRTAFLVIYLLYEHRYPLSCVTFIQVTDEVIPFVIKMTMMVKRRSMPLPTLRCPHVTESCTMVMMMMMGKT